MTNYIEDATGLEAFKSLTFLKWQYFKGSSIDLSSLTNLEKIWVHSFSDNVTGDSPTLESITFPVTNVLNEINVKDNILNSIDVSFLDNLEHLEVQGHSPTILSNLNSIDVTSNIKLKHLNAGRNKINNLNVLNNIHLETLLLMDNKIKYLDVLKIENLQYFTIKHPHFAG